MSKTNERQSGSATTAPRAESGTGHYPRNVHSSQSSVENHYPKSNASNPYGYDIVRTPIFYIVSIQSLNN